MREPMIGRAMARWLAAMVCVAAVGAASAQEAKTPEGYKVVYEQSFDSKDALAEFEFTNPAKWIYTDKGKEGGAIEFLGNATTADWTLGRWLVQDGGDCVGGCLS